MKTRSVSILLTRMNGRFGTFIYWVTGRRFTHASIRLDEMGENFYSFNFRGLCEERPGFFSPRRVSDSALYRLELSEPLYEELKERLEEFLESRHEYRYSRLGLALCLLGIPHRFPGAFFCSQFVGELLTRAEVIRLEQDASLCAPKRLGHARQRCAQTVTMVPNPVFSSAF